MNISPEHKKSFSISNLEKLKVRGPNNYSYHTPQDQSNNRRDKLISLKLSKLQDPRRNDMREQIKKLQSLVDLQKEQLSNAPIFTTLEQDNIRLTDIVRQLELQVKDLEQYKKNYACLQTKLIGQKNLINQLQAELRQFKDRDTLFQQKHGQDLQKIQLQKLANDQNKLSQQMQEDQAKYEESQLRWKKEQLKLEQIIMEKDDEIIQLRLKIDTLSKQLYEESMKVHHLKKAEKSYFGLQNQGSFSHHRPSLSQNTIARLISKEYSPTMSQRSIIDKSKQHLKLKVSKEDLQDLSKLIKYRLINQQISLNQIDKYIFKQEEETELEDLIQVFQDKPFNLTKEQSITISNYLIDSEESPYIQTNARIRSIFKSLLENYKIPTQEEEEKIKDYIRIHMKEQKFQIHTYLLSKESNTNYTVDILFEALLANDIKLNKIQSEYLQAYLYKLNGQLNQFQLSQLDDLCQL